MDLKEGIMAEVEEEVQNKGIPLMIKEVIKVASNAISARSMGT